MSAIKLLDNVSTNTVGDAKHGKGSSYNLTVFGDSLGGGVVTIEISDDGGSHWVPVTFQASPLALTTFTSIFLERIAQGQLVRATLASATSPVNVSVYLSH